MESEYYTSRSTESVALQAFLISLHVLLLKNVINLRIRIFSLT
jgi:hypothetical protein